MVAAYVLIQTEVGKAGPVARAIAEIKGVHGVEAVAGPYGGHRPRRGARHGRPGRLIVSQIQAVNGVTRTPTCAVTHL
jgi:hypothetical protein